MDVYETLKMKGAVVGGSPKNETGFATIDTSPGAAGVVAPATDRPLEPGVSPTRELPIISQGRVMDVVAPVMTGYAVDTVGEAVIEVAFKTKIGTVITYYHLAEICEGQNGRKFLVLLANTKKAAGQRFIPAVTKDSEPIAISITGKDKKPMNLNVVPLGIFYQVLNWEHLILLIYKEPLEGTPE